MEKKFKVEVSSFFLHILAMALMLCDHLWASVVTGNEWLTAIGRLAFPLFAFLIAEGYFHTRSPKKYATRIFLFAIISEIPFNLFTSGAIINPFHQNVLFTLGLGLLLICLNERVKDKRIFIRILVGVATTLAGFVLGFVLMLDYYGVGVVTVLAFYFLNKRVWWCRLLQLAVLWILNAEILGGLGYEVSVFGIDLFIKQQSFAVLSLIPIWLYRGRQGYYNKAVKYFYYAFYPLHMLLLALIMIF